MEKRKSDAWSVCVKPITFVAVEIRLLFISILYHPDGICTGDICTVHSIFGGYEYPGRTEQTGEQRGRGNAETGSSKTL